MQCQDTFSTDTLTRAFVLQHTSSLKDKLGLVFLFEIPFSRSSEHVFSLGYPRTDWPLGLVSTSGLISNSQISSKLMPASGLTRPKSSPSTRRLHMQLNPKVWEQCWWAHGRCEGKEVGTVKESTSGWRHGVSQTLQAWLELHGSPYSIFLSCFLARNRLCQAARWLSQSNFLPLDWRRQLF